MANMEIDNLLATAQKVFSQDEYASRLLGCKIEEVRPHYSRCTLEVDNLHRNAMGAVMGGAMFSLADFAFAVASNTDYLEKNEPIRCVSLNSCITFLSNTLDNHLVAYTECIRHGRTTCVYQIKVEDGCGKLLAVVSVTGMRV